MAKRNKIKEKCEAAAKEFVRDLSEDQKTKEFVDNARVEMELAKQSRLLLTDVLNRAYAIISTSQKELAAMNLTPEEMSSTESTQRIFLARYLLSLQTVISDILSPAYEISKVLCAKENHAFIDQIREKYLLLVEAEKNRKEAAEKTAAEVKVMIDDEK